MKTEKKSKFTLAVLFILIVSCFLSSCALFPLEEDEIPQNENPNQNEQPENNENPENSEKKDPENFTVAYYSGEKIDPYSSVNRSNRAVVSLCYEGLISLDSSMSPSAEIADFSAEGNTVTFTVKDSAKFSDGSQVTASDIIYSFDRAKASGLYSFRFEKYIGSYRAVSQSKVTVTFKNSNIYNVNLFDFPIVKKNSSGVYPTGSGKYVITTKDGVLALEKNAYYAGSENFTIDSVSLVEITDAQDLNYNFNYGDLCAAYADLSDGSQRYKGNVELVTFMTNSLVFAVVNKSKGYFASNEVSYAVSLVIARKSISADCLDSLGDIVWQPFNLNWCELENKDIKKDIYSSSAAHEIFTKRGLTLSGSKRTWRGSPLELTVICNNENRIRVRIANAVAASLREMGFTVNVVLYNWNDYKKVIASGDYDIYIAETDIPANFDIRYMFSDGVVNTHSGVSQNFLSALDGFYSGNTDAATLFSSFTSEMPFIPLYYNRGALAVNRVVSGNFEPTENSIFNGIEKWTMESGK